MVELLSIGDFARATHLTIKTLRHYHQAHLLEPADIDESTGYRRYGVEQIPTAQVIRRFRDLDMPLESIRAILTSSDLESRNEQIAAHLRHLEDGLAATQLAVSSLRDLLEHPVSDDAIEHRAIEATRAAMVTEDVAVADAMDWQQGALGELRATLFAQGIEPSGPAGGMFSNQLFTEGRGSATVFVPCTSGPRPVGRITAGLVPAIELATLVHHGSPVSSIDRAYGALATHVARHALAVDAPIREYYLVDGHDDPDPDAWRTVVGWPIFATGRV